MNLIVKEKIIRCGILLLFFIFQEPIYIYLYNLLIYIYVGIHF